MRALAAHLAALILALVLATPDVRAQAEDRGYGGPATVGPNFSTGKQSEAPDYGSGGAKKPAYKKPSAAKASAPNKSKSAAKPAKSKPATRSAAKPVKPSKSETAAKAKPNTDQAKPTAAGDAKTASDAPADTTAPASSETTPATGETTPATTAAKPETCRRFDATTGTTLEVACE